LPNRTLRENHRCGGGGSSAADSANAQVRPYPTSLLPSRPVRWITRSSATGTPPSSAAAPGANVTDARSCALPAWATASSTVSMPEASAPGSSTGRS
jgi:hypothetical protein